LIHGRAALPGVRGSILARRSSAYRDPDDWFGFERKWEELSAKGLRLVHIAVFGSSVEQ
jgi:hypothetical protein